MNNKLNFFWAGIFFLAVGMTTSGCSKDEDSNTAPIISSVQVNPSSVSAGGFATIQVIASDADGDQLTYSYSVSGGAVNGNGPSANWTAPSQAGAYSVTVTVTDGNGGEASSNGSLTVSMAVTQISGTASFAVGSSGDLSNAKVSLYTSVNEWVNNNPLQFGVVSGSGASVSFNLTGMVPGAYYLDVWKDNDNDGNWTSGDFVGAHGNGGLGSSDLTQFQIAQGQSVNLQIGMFILP